ncbi:RraA family protein (plasmid) [Streptomyces sp. BI20]|uniref:RraA family protein n=1 Tax=Streptomyces sp. BI20 TaxID=3403460 RepID=UPI003C77CF44
MTGQNEQEIRRLAALFAPLGCALLHDAAPDHAAVVDAPLRSRTPGLPIAGPVFPVHTDNDMLPVLQALDQAPPGWVILVRNTAARSEALAGDIMATACKHRGLAGLIVDGAVRDVDTLPAIGFPVHSTEVTFVSAKTAKVPARQVPETVTVGGRTLRPGDWIFADGDGVLTVPAETAGPVIRAAVLLGRREEELRARLRAGETMGDLCGLADFLAGRAPLRFEV